MSKLDAAHLPLLQSQRVTKTHQKTLHSYRFSQVLSVLLEGLSKFMFWCLLLLMVYRDKTGYRLCWC